jgi:hypothetical protein
MRRVLNFELSAQFGEGAGIEEVFLEDPVHGGV